MPRSLDEIFGNTPPSSGTGRSLDQIFGGSPSTVAPPPVAKKQQSWIDSPPVRNTLAGLEWATQTPVAHGLNALVNATSAAGTGFVAGLGQKDTTALPKPVRPFAEPAASVISPFSSSFNAVKNPGTLIDTAHQAEQRLGFETPEERKQEDLYKIPLVGPALSDVNQALLDFAVLTALDPATYRPGLNVFSIGSRALGMVPRAANAVNRAVFTPLVNRAGKALDATVQNIEQGHRARFPWSVPDPSEVETAVKDLGPPKKPSEKVQAAFQGGVERVGRYKNRALAGLVEFEKERQGGALRPAEDYAKGHEGAEFNARKRQEESYKELRARNEGQIEAWQEHRNQLLRDIKARTLDPKLRHRVEHQALLPKERADWPEGSLARIDAERAALEEQLKAHEQQFPLEVRQALLKRAYREGTARVRALALNRMLQVAKAHGEDVSMAALADPQKRALLIQKGYLPTDEERGAPVLNILHQFRDAYEPTHDIYDAGRTGGEVAQLNKVAASSGPVYYIKQGQKKAKFDLPGVNPDPNKPLMERIHDRLVRGARIEEYYRARHGFLRDTGALPLPDLERTGERLEQAKQEMGDALPLFQAAMQTGDPRLIAALVGKIGQNEKRASRYAALEKLQQQAAIEASRRRSLAFSQDAPYKEVGMELVDPQTLQRRMAREFNIADKGFGAALKMQPGARKIDTKVLQSKFIGGKRAVANAERVAQISQRAAETTKKAAEEAAAQQAEQQFSRFFKITEALEKQSERTSKLGNALENHQLVRAGYRSDIPKLRDDVRQLQAAYLAAKRLAGTAYKSGLGKNVDDELQRIAAHRLDHPAGTNLTVVDREGLPPIVKGGKSVGFTPYAQGEIDRVLSALKKSRAKAEAPPTRADAIRHLDEAMNAIGAARDNVERVAKRYDVSTTGMSPEGISQSIQEMGNAFRSSLGYVQGQLKKTPPVPAEIKGGIKSVVRGQERLAGALTEASAPQVGAASFKHILNPSQHAAAEGKASLAKVIKATQQTAQKLESAQEAKKTDKEVVAMANDLAKRLNRVQIPEALADRFFGDKAAYNSSMIKLFSDLQREALFVLPFAHMKNVSVLVALGPNGKETLGKGIGYYRALRKARDAGKKLHIRSGEKIPLAELFKGDPEALREAEKLEANKQELLQFGGTTEFFRDPEKDTMFEKIPGAGKAVKDVGQWSADALDDYDTAMRMALSDELKSRGLSGFELAGQVRDILGDYHNQAPVIRELRDRLGATFPGWGLGIVPRAMGKAFREHPGTVKLYARGNEVVNDDITDPKMKSFLNVGGPAEDAAEMALEPWKYFSSPARLGPLGSTLQGVGYATQHAGLEKLGLEQAQRLTPFGTALGGLLEFPYPSNAPMAVRGAGGLLGMYFPGKPTRKKRAKQLMDLHIPYHERQDILRSEGYIKPLAAPILEQNGGIDWSRP